MKDCEKEEIIPEDDFQFGSWLRASPGFKANFRAKIEDDLRGDKMRMGPKDGEPR